MPLPLGSVFFPEHLAEKCRTEGTSHFPLEAGGVLMGYRTAKQVVVTQVIGSGPGADHRSHSFEPNYNWQNDQIARHYEKSGRRETYLGDWHTHPRATSGTLSRHDRAVIRQIIQAPAARASLPLMGIFYGEPEKWDLVIWRGQLVSGWLGFQRLRIAALTIDAEIRVTA